MSKVLKGKVLKGMFEGEIRAFFYPDEYVKDIVPFSNEKVSLLISEMGYMFIKRGYMEVLITFPDLQTIQYPVFVEGVDVRAVHLLTGAEQTAVKKFCSTYNKTTREYQAPRLM